MATPQIKILPEDLINKIAAGEVVERPASIVKELVENSIDAKATKISVEIQGAGRRLIRVSDNGCGMSEEEFGLAVRRHATSKISHLDDLFNIRSLGFRGEALPSIASVSNFTLEQNPSGQGITAKVQDLFYNTPARKKFLKSPATEMGHIGDIVSKYTLAYPQIAFELISEGKPMIQSSGSGSLRDAAMSVYGLDIARDLIEVRGDKVSGLVSRPTRTRIDRYYETFFVNGRYVRSFLLNRALEDAYRTLIPGNRYPIAILFINIDPKKIDVNVHPAKREVKFVRTQEVMDWVRVAVRQALENVLGNQIISASEQDDQGIRGAVYQGEEQILFSGGEQSLESFSGANLEVSLGQPLAPLYQYKDTYIVATDGEKLAIIDQHAAHERVIYDQLSSAVVSSIGSQPLLSPENIELDHKAVLALKDNLDYLKSLGFDLEEFGAKSYLLRAVPAVVVKTGTKQLLFDIIAELQELGSSAQLETKQENIRKTIACKAAVKAHDKLSAQEMNQLIKDLYATKNPLTCPHGRPTIIQIAEEDLIKQFGR